MTRKEIEQQAEQFFTFPGDEKTVVTYTSALLFAEHCVREAINGRLRQGHIDRMGGK